MEQTEFEQIAASLRAKALDAALRCGLAGDEAEDTAQNTMLKLWAMRAELESYRSVEALAVCVARHLSIDTLRRCHTLPLDAQLAHPDTSPTPDAQLEAIENEQWLLSRLAQLPSTEYQILRLRQVEHRSNAEIAAILGITATSVATLLSRARHRLLDDIKKKKRKDERLI